MGWMAEQHKRRRKRIAHMIREGFSNKEMYAQGCAPTTVHSVRHELGIPDPGDLLTHPEVAKARGFGTPKSLNPPRRRRKRWEEVWEDGPQEK